MDVYWVFSGVGLFCIDSKDLTRSLLCQLLSLRCQDTLVARGCCAMGQSGHFPEWCLELAVHFPSHYHGSVALSSDLWALRFYQLSLWKLLINLGLGCCQRFCKSGVPPSPCKKTCLRGSSDKEKAKVSSKLGSLKEETRRVSTYYQRIWLSSTKQMPEYQPYREYWGFVLFCFVLCSHPEYSC